MSTDGEDSPDEEGPILSPEEIGIADREGVVEIEDGRYVVSADGRPPKVDPVDPVDEGDSGDDHDAPSAGGRRPTYDPETLDRWLRERAREADGRYGFDVTATFDGQPRRHRAASDDVVATFESLLRWFCVGLDGEGPPSVTLAILLAESDLNPRFPVVTLRAFLDHHDIDPEDPIEELLARTEDGFVFPGVSLSE
jgi:hypothetical protein